MKILVVDDEKLLVKGLKFNLENDGYEVDGCHDGETAVEMAKNNNYSLILLDLMMPKLDGLNTCMQMREFTNVPIIMLTAKSEDTDKLIGFEYGADDYITKPFNILEVKARVRALLRRSASTAAANPNKDSSRITKNNITIDTVRRSAENNSKLVELTMKEFDLIELLMRNAGKVFSRENLLDTVWGYDYQGDIRTVDVHIRRLREKLEKNPAVPECIITKWGIGYYFSEL